MKSSVLLAWKKNEASKVTSKEQAQTLGINVDMDIVQQGAQLAVDGHLAKFAKNWEEIFSDPWILKTIQGYQVEFHTSPQQIGYPNEIRLNTTQCQAMTKEEEKLIRKEAILAALHDKEGFMSQMFHVPKSDRSWRRSTSSPSTIIWLHVTSRWSQLEQPKA